ncbi:MAG: hypothetical protein PHR35_19285, partial [Kiritimatiellae bacterium]|nr:hypothetical protein [Kiritimatiellia bacterium]
MKRHSITLRALLVGLLASAGGAVLAILSQNFQQVLLASCQIPVLPYLLLIVMVLLLNPFFRLIRVVRVFSAVELLVVFLMGSVSAGIANFGLVEQVLPI